MVSLETSERDHSLHMVLLMLYRSIELLLQWLQILQGQLPASRRPLPKSKAYLTLYDGYAWHNTARLVMTHSSNKVKLVQAVFWVRSAVVPAQLIFLCQLHAHSLIIIVQSCAQALPSTRQGCCEMTNNVSGL